MSSNQATAAHAVKLSAGGAVSRITRLTRLQLSDGDPIASGEDCFNDVSGAMAKRRQPWCCLRHIRGCTSLGSSSSSTSSSSGRPPVYLVDGERVLERLWLQVRH